jgi:hypothetical protein
MKRTSASHADTCLVSQEIYIDFVEPITVSAKPQPLDSVRLRSHYTLSLEDIRLKFGTHILPFPYVHAPSTSPLLICSPYYRIIRRAEIKSLHDCFFLIQIQSCGCKIYVIRK